MAQKNTIHEIEFLVKQRELNNRSESFEAWNFSNADDLFSDAVIMS